MALLKEQVNKIKEFFYKTSSRTPGKISIYLSSAVLFILLILFLVLFVFADSILNGYVKNKLISSVESTPGIKMEIGYLGYNLFKNGITIDNLDLVKTDLKDSTVELHIKNSFAEIKNINWLRILFKKGYSFGGISIQNFFIRINENEKKKKIQADSAVKNNSGEKINLKKILTGLIPAKLLPLYIGKFTLNYGNLLVNGKSGTKYLPADSVKNISLEIENINISSEEEKKLNIVERVTLSIEHLQHRFKSSGYQLKMDSLFISTEDSVVSAKMFRFVPYISDSLFFADKKFKTNRFITTIKKFKITGIDYPGIIRDNSLFIRNIFMDDFLADIVTNKRLPDDPGNKIPKMPNELLKSVENKIIVNSINISGGLIRYTELFPYSDEPAVISFRNVNALIKNIANFKRDSVYTPAQINISSELAGAGRLSLVMNLNLVSDAFYLNYKGRLDSMDMTILNDFLKIDAGVIVKSCKVKYVDFNVDVNNGHATGFVKPVYDNLKIEKLDKEKGKASILSKVLSFFARNAKIHESNPQDGELRTGRVDRGHSKDEAFIHFIWVAVRDGLGDAAGF